MAGKNGHKIKSWGLEFVLLCSKIGLRGWGKGWILESAVGDVLLVRETKYQIKTYFKNGVEEDLWLAL